jgi:hypothetical protein
MLNLFSAAPKKPKNYYKGEAMEHRTGRKLIQAATLSFFVLTTTSGIAGWKIVTANPAISQADGPGGVLVQRSSADQPDPPPTPTPTPVPPLPVP